ncbi:MULTISPECIES: acyl carrier protein [unclassified Streptomyces]|uniref:acyl carrier protein n=1 Tax=unclassified Streptomyces TaxID=2593676 RepID=UPI0033A79F93
MTKEQIVEDVKNILGEMVCVTPEQVAEEMSLIADLKADSLLKFELFLALDDHFDISLPKKDLSESAETVSDVIAYVEKSLSA